MLDGEKELDDFIRKENAILHRNQGDILRGLVDEMVTTQAVRVALKEDGLDPDRIDGIVATIEEVENTVSGDADM
ncbi:hypothetical protein [Halorubrum sp. AJ67]|uniref:hypothetical protein n=1 Tax=Halorubrum sp. AJ67 TaxID=1173487 RepID=UPI0003DB8DFC|nr:hypothetical protein [Halorubrum sp. AJ67]CDK39632.1 hypothetical protein BN903_31 [Halorubrum sp. AJ67]